ncbi:MAG: serine/threonine-protein kinase [Planctomycetota bacterium]
MPKTTDKLRQAQHILDLALALAPDDQDAFVADACGGDPNLLAQVNALLAGARSVPTGFMQPPEPLPGLRRPQPANGPDPLLGQRVGEYRIERVIGTGGMGCVYEATQDHPQRRVALKVMRANVTSRSALRRFQFEAEVLGHLRHPHIAQIYQAGVHDTDAGRVPFFALEWVPDARTIVQYARENELTTRKRLELFAKVCDAVHHGHQKGIIHRDLKPANILVDPDGEPKVIDFGIARATDADIAITTMHTDAGQIIGTLQYMSPEQCDANPHEIDTRSDVYSLGVVLYELLTGELPYEATGTTIVQAAQIIREHSPQALSTINRELRGDIETIVMKALEKNREFRYQSAAGLADDIRRHLGGEPVMARPPTVWTRTLRWVTRHPAVSTALVCLAIGACIVGASFGTAWMLSTRPYKIDLNDDHSEARMVSVNGRDLKTWTSVPKGFAFADLLERPPESGGGRLALLGCNWQFGGNQAGALCAYDAGGDLDTPLWKSRLRTEDIPAWLQARRGFVGRHFSITDNYALLDVFPERPGREIVAVFTHVDLSQRVLCIYDLRGELLYRAWHDGCLGRGYWMKDARLLVLAGTDASENWTPEGAALTAKPDPPIVIALRPAMGALVDHSNLLELPGHDPHAPAWCRRLEPEILISADTSLRTETPRPPRHPGSHVRVVVRSGETIGDVAWVIDDSGEEVPGSRSVGDRYKHNQLLPDGDPNKLPDPHAYKLVPMNLSERR